MEMVYYDATWLAPQAEWQQCAGAAGEYFALPHVVSGGEHVIRSAAPWWPDPNHAPTPGAKVSSGWLSLHALAKGYNYSSSITPPIIYTPGDLDLVGCIFEAHISAKNFSLPKNSITGLWAQSMDPRLEKGDGRYDNRLQVRDLISAQLGFPPPIDRAGPLVRSTTQTICRVPITEIDSHWLPLGSRADKEYLYSNGSADVMRRWNVGIGVITLSKSLADAQAVAGALEFHRIRIYKP